jgi:hypothetical protein
VTLLGRRDTLLIILAWLALGPIAGTILSHFTGEARATAIIFTTGGGLLGGGMYWLVGGNDVITAALCVLIRALTVVLLSHTVGGLIELPASSN